MIHTTITVTIELQSNNIEDTKDACLDLRATLHDHFNNNHYPGVKLTRQRIVGEYVEQG